MDHHLIKCIYNDESVTCEKYFISLRDKLTQEIFFINGNYKIKDSEDYLIKCSTTDECMENSGCMDINECVIYGKGITF